MTVKSIYLSFALLCVLSIGHAQTKEQALKDAQLTSKAAVDLNIDILLDHTLPSVIELMGGRESAKTMLDQTYSSMAAQGYKFEKSEIVSVSEIIKEQGQYRCIVENHIDIVTTGQRIKSKSFLLGVYNETDGYWWFIEAKQLQIPSMAEQIIPGFETSLDIPKDDVQYEPLED